jgi:glycosyltransferase involved in cell wall biosynthesis
MHFVIVTPCWNAAGLIEDTVRSIADQTALRDSGVSVTYVVADGGSTDSTLDIVRGAWSENESASLRIISEPDNGMYDALAKAFELDIEGDVYAYLNAGDMYSRTCFEVVRECFDNLHVEWLTGMRVKYNEHGVLVEAYTPHPYRRDLISSGYHGIRPGAGAFIQQESTFWNKALMERVEPDRLRGFKLAGDFYLWKTFAEHAELTVVTAHLGGFRVHSGQLSEAIDAYRAEALTISDRSLPFGRTRARFRELNSLIPPRWRTRIPGFSSGAHIEWSDAERQWSLIGPAQ